MIYEMRNFIKFSKPKASNVGQSKRNDDWKRERKQARRSKQMLRHGVTNYKSKRIA